jgi:glycine/sarcosine N-methyltransferase
MLTGMTDDYGELARDYEWLFAADIVGSQGNFGATSPGNQDLLERLLGTLPAGSRVLDCACGIGADAAALSRRGFAVTATDGSAAMVAETRRRLLRYGITLDHLAQALWQELPERVSGPFPLVLCLGNAIVHTRTADGMARALAGMRNVLASDGMLVVDSRNWELLYRTRPRIVPARRVIERHGVRCTSLYVWTIPEDFPGAWRAEIVLLFEDRDGALSHHRHVLDYRPFRHDDLTAAIRAAGFVIQGDSYTLDGPFYAIAAAPDPAAWI